MARGGHLGSCPPNEKKNAFSLNNLTDELLIEILRRLPTPKSVLAGCILVCKRWHSLIFSSYFVSQFEEHHRNQNKNSYYPAYQKPPSVFIAPEFYSIWSHCNPNRNIYQLLLATGTAEDAIPELDFLPEKRDCVSVVASCNDLLLCRAVDFSRRSKYYVCNLLTKQWCRLPPSATDIRDHNWLSLAKFGLVYESNNGILDQEKYECRFRVLVFFHRDHSMHVYCSETKRWDEFPLLGEEYRPYSCAIFAFEGKLYWCNARVDGSVVAYDPFRHETTFIRYGLDVKISKNEGKRRTVIYFCLGICQGTLRFMRFERGDVTIVDDICVYLSVWELKDYESRRLTLKHSIFFNLENPALQRLFYAKPLGFHPTEEDMVYMAIWNDDHTVLSYKIEEEGSETLLKGGYSHYKKHHESYILLKVELAITTMLPWWPTPVSKATL